MAVYTSLSNKNKCRFGGDLLLTCDGRLIQGYRASHHTDEREKKKDRERHKVKKRKKTTKPMSALSSKMRWERYNAMAKGTREKTK